MRHLVVEYPDDLAEAAGLKPEIMGAHLKLMAALKMFELGELSSGAAADLAGMTRIEFVDVCATYRIALFNYSDAEVAEELKADAIAAKHARQ